MSTQADALLQLVAFFRERDAREASPVRLAAHAAPAHAAHAPAVQHVLSNLVPATAVARPNGFRAGHDPGFRRF